MRKNSPRHWLHATLDLLPVILIPVFMIYSHRHTIDSYSVTRQERENQPYNFYQCVKNGKPTSDLTTWSFQCDHTYNNDWLQLTNSILYENWGQASVDVDFLSLNQNDKIYYRFNYKNEHEFDFNLNLYGDVDDDSLGLFYDSLLDDMSDNIFLDGIVANDLYLEQDQNIKLNFVYESSLDFFAIKNIQIFNLTQIFGVGNEPSITNFRNMLTQDYYEYGNNYVDNYVMVSKTYNDTDIMSQFTYNLYNSVDKYFNMGNVFGMNNVYTWFETNIFHGTSPLYIYIVWNIILYEFVMDLLFLLYALFMWFVDVTKRLVEKPLDSIK